MKLLLIILILLCSCSKQIQPVKHNELNKIKNPEESKKENQKAARYGTIGILIVASIIVSYFPEKDK